MSLPPFLVGSLSRLCPAKTRSISAENPTGDRGRGATEVPSPTSHAAPLGIGWKARPCARIEPAQVFTVAEISGMGVVQHIWLTLAGNARFSILRIYWEGSDKPSVQCPVADFFANAWGEFAQVSSLAVCVNPNRGYNSYWEMPFRKHCRITIENLGPEALTLYYQVTFALTEVPDEAAYFHSQFRRSNPVPDKQVHTLLDGVRGHGHYVGTYLAWSVNRPGWWGEGEIKFYLDGDREFPTICGTGTEDYFGGAWNFDAGGYQTFTGPYSGLPQIVRPDGLYKSQTRFGLYRWHLVDPIRFETELRVTIQALGWKRERYVCRQDDVASVAFWYQTLPTAPFPSLPSREDLEID